MIEAIVYQKVYLYGFYLFLGLQLDHRFTVGRFSCRNHLLCGQYRGDDGNNGTSQDSAWRSLDKVNATTFAPGDKILFKAGKAGMAGCGLKVPVQAEIRSLSICTVPEANH